MTMDGSTRAESTSRGTPLLSVVVPAFNEEGRISGALESVRAYARGFDGGGGDIELVVVDDGSSDGTVGVVRAFAESVGGVGNGGREPGFAVRLIEQGRNRGKGAAVRRGMLEARGLWRLMCDADMATPIEEFDRLRPHLEAGARVVIASRDMPESRLEPAQPWRRRVSGWVFRALRRSLMLRHVRDSQCGFKAFEGALAEAVFALQEDERFAFDVEVLALAEKMGERVVEVGVLWRDNRDSRVRIVRDSVDMLRTLIRLRGRLRGMETPEAPAALRREPALVEVRSGVVGGVGVRRG